MNKLCAIICLLLAVIVLPIVAFAQSQKNQSENLSRFKEQLKQEQEKTGFLDVWNDESMDLFTSIVKDSGIVIEYIDPDKYYDGEWLTPYHALQNVFEEVWGDKTTWSLEQQYEYAHFEIEIGLSDQTVAALPTAEDLSVDEARRLVQEKLYAELAEERDASRIDLGNYHESVHFWRYPDLGGTWVLNIMAKIEKRRSISELYTRILAAFRLIFMTKMTCRHYINIIALCIIFRLSTGGGWMISMSSIH